MVGMRNKPEPPVTGTATSPAKQDKHVTFGPGLLEGIAGEEIRVGQAVIVRSDGKLYLFRDRAVPINWHIDGAVKP
jgi:hypothetical protein